MKFQILFVLALGLFISCKKESNLTKDCISKQLVYAHMIPYVGQEIGYKYYLDLYELDGNQYYFLNNNYIDFSPVIIDCDGKLVCGKNPTPECNNILLNAKFVKTVGIEP